MVKQSQENREFFNYLFKVTYTSLDDSPDGTFFITDDCIEDAMKQGSDMLGEEECIRKIEYAGTLEVKK